MKSYFIIFFVVFVFQSVVYGQIDSVQHLEEVYLTSTYISKDFSDFDVKIIPDSTLEKKRFNLIALLQNEFNLYLKQYGNGMLTSIASRGTSAAQTAVFWNNVPINSALNGQVDINTLMLSGISGIQYKRSGSSTLLGSGAIAGGINFSSSEAFNQTQFVLHQDISSFQTYNTSGNLNFGTKNQVFTADINFETSENDYTIPRKNFLNTNGQYKKIGLSFGEKIRWNNNQLFFRSLLSINDRNTAGSLYAISNSKIKYNTQYFQTGWVHQKNGHQMDVKLSYLKENYDYYYNKDIIENASFNASEKWYQTLDYRQNIRPNAKLYVGYVLERTQGIGDNIGSKTILKAAFYSLWQQKLREKLNYNFSMRKEWSNYFKVPLIFSLDAFYHFNAQKSLNFNVSSNFRNPTLNDLFWNPGGNPHLKPEKSLQSEIGFQIVGVLGALKSQIFIIQNRDYIQWRPNSNGFWQPINIQKTRNYGVEFQWNNAKKVNRMFHYNLSYSFTRAEDMLTKKQLFYVPYHVASGQLSYLWKKWVLSTSGHYKGSVYTTSDQSKVLEGYYVQNIKLSRSFLNNKININFDVNNLFNTYYEVIEAYPMPGINFGMQVRFEIF